MERYIIAKQGKQLKMTRNKKTRPIGLDTVEISVDFKL